MTLSRVIDKIWSGKLWDFHGGIHPEEHKLESSEVPLVEAAIPPLLVLPLKQHIGSSAEVIVKPGDRVLTGQPLTRPESRMQVPIHAPTSGIISSIEPHTVAHPSGLSELCIHLQPDGLDEWRERFPLPDYQSLTPLELVGRIHEAGIAGLGGAGFPTDVKLATGREKVEILIINGAECEPYISCDDRLMREEAQRIAEGIEVVRHILKPRLVLIAIEDNKPQAIAAMQAVVDGEQVQVRVIPTKYPSGAARQLIEVLTGRQVPSGKRSLTLGIIMLNVGTVFAVRQAVIDDEPLIRRVVTLTGDRFGKPGNAWVRLGTSVRWLLGQFQLNPEPRQRIIMGGPMMGFTLPHADVPIVKISNCLMAPSEVELPPPGEEMNCIRCGQCADACPVSLLPQQLYWYSKAGEHDKAQEYRLDDCIECGACAWVCPSSIPLVQYYREEKAELRRLEEEAQQAERAKQRFEAKKQRLEADRLSRENRHQQASQARREQMTQQAGGSDPIAAALARVKARQAELAASATTPGIPNLGSEAIQAARAARKQQALQRQQGSATQPAAVTPVLTVASPAQDNPAQTSTDPKTAAIAAAVARAKARKTEQQAASDAPVTPSETATTQPAIPTATETPASETTELDPKKAAIAAAVARAKARKAEQQAAATQPAMSTAAEIAVPETPIPERAAPETTELDPKKAAIAAAVARAKARKAEQQAAATQPAETQAPEAPAPETTALDPKKAAIAAAVARAKARKAEQVAAQQAEQSASAPADPTPSSSTESH
jgi:electron transport complex protein RnfC